MSFVLKDDFCPKCGAVLLFPEERSEEYIRCKCDFKLSVEAWDGTIISKTEIIFNEISEKKDKKSKKDKNMIGPTIERLCVHCGHNKMTYKTQQMRSADEGMSIFYYCLKCGKLEKEDS